MMVRAVKISISGSTVISIAADQEKTIIHEAKRKILGQASRIRNKNIKLQIFRF